MTKRPRIDPAKPVLTAFWALAVFIAFKALRFRLIDRDLWWHLANGRQMLEQHAFLRTDVFSHTMFGAKWVNFEWLSEIALAYFVQRSGFEVILYGKVVLGLAILLGLALAVRKAGARGAMVLLLTIWGFLILKPRLFERVELVTLLFLPLLMFAILRTRTCEVCKKKLPWACLILFALWCNLHAGFVYGLGILALFNIGARWSGEPREFTRTLDFSLGAAVLGSLINPFGVGLASIFVEHLQQLTKGPSVISEWKTATPADAPWFWLLYLAAGAFLIRGFLIKRNDIRLWAPVVLVFTLWGALYFRNAAVAALVLLPFVASALPLNPFLNLFAGVIAVVGLGFLTKSATVPTPTGIVQEERLPMGACEYVHERNIQGTMYNAYHYGGYIEWVLGPERKVFMDGRYIFHPLLLDHVRLNELSLNDPRSPAWPDYLASKGVNYAIVDYDTVLLDAMFPRKDWALVYWDDASLVFLKRTPAFAAIIRSDEYKSLWPYNPALMNYMILKGVLRPSDVLSDLRKHESNLSFSVARNALMSELEPVFSRPSGGPKSR